MPRGRRELELRGLQYDDAEADLRPVLQERGDACAELILDPTPLHPNLGMHRCPALCRLVNPIMYRTFGTVQSYTRQLGRRAKPRPGEPTDGHPQPFEEVNPY